MNVKTFIKLKTDFFYLIENLIFFLEFKVKYLNNTALIIAACNGHTEIVHELLLQDGIDINIKDI